MSSGRPGGDENFAALVEQLRANLQWPPLQVTVLETYAQTHGGTALQLGTLAELDDVVGRQVLSLQYPQGTSEALPRPSTTQAALPAWAAHQSADRGAS